MNTTWEDSSSVGMPHWLLSTQKELQSKKYLNDASKMDLVLMCAQKNVENASGAPLAAAVFLEDGSLVSVGLETPGIGGHEMTNALLIASNVLGYQTLRSNRNWDLFSLAPPCLSCQGFIYSERPKRFVCAIGYDQLLSAIELPNTPPPSNDWLDRFSSRGIEVKMAIDPGKGMYTLRFRR